MVAVKRISTFWSRRLKVAFVFLDLLKFIWKYEFAFI